MTAVGFGFSLAGLGVVLLADCGGSAFSSSNPAGGGGGTTPGGASGNGALAGNTNGGMQSVGGTSSGGNAASAHGGSGTGGDVSISGNAGMSAAGMNSAGSGGSSAGNGGTVLDRCPPDPPASGACKTGLVCTYGTDLRVACRDNYRCLSGKWQATVAACTPLSDCSAVDGGVRQVGSACPTVGEDCTLDNGSFGLIYCRCDNRVDPGAPPRTSWDCQGPPQKPCPQALPNQGTPCDSSVNGDTCVYGSCDFGAGSSVAGLQCDNGVWIQTSGGCPI